MVSASAHPTASVSSAAAIQSLAPSYQVAYQKQQEHLGLQGLREASADMMMRAEKLAEQSSIMADGGEAIGAVLRNWPHVFGILNLFDQPPPTHSRSELAEDEPDEPIPQLVRLPYTSEAVPKEPQGTARG